MDQPPPPAAGQAFDIGDRIDSGPWTAWQKRVVLLVALAIILDGFDNQILGFVAPVLLKQWGITRDALAPVFAAGFFGMVVGAMAGGFLGDRLGRRPALIGSVVVFGVATGLTALADNLFTLGALRAVAGLGLGGAMPNAATLLAEFAPRRWRSLSVTLGIVCIPLGGVGGGFVAAALLPVWGWHSRLSWRCCCGWPCRNRRAFWPSALTVALSLSQCCAAWATMSMLQPVSMNQQPSQRRPRPCAPFSRAALPLIVACCGRRSLPACSRPMWCSAGRPRCWLTLARASPLPVSVSPRSTSAASPAQ